MIINILNKPLFLLIGFIFLSGFTFAQKVKEQSKSSEHNTSEAGFDRTLRKGEEGKDWAWGSMGHGSFDQAIEIFKNDEFFKPEKDVMVYKEGSVKCKVFTYSKINYIEVDYGWRTFIYITK